MSLWFHNFSFLCYNKITNQPRFCNYFHQYFRFHQTNVPFHWANHFRYKFQRICSYHILELKLKNDLLFYNCSFLCYKKHNESTWVLQHPSSLLSVPSINLNFHWAFNFHYHFQQNLQFLNILIEIKKLVCDSITFPFYVTIK